MIETFGLSDKEKKLIFTPKKYLLEEDNRDSTMKYAIDQKEFDENKKMIE